MTLGTTAPSVDYVENGSTTAHPIPFQFRYASEIRCTRFLLGIPTLMVQGPDYAVAGGGGGTGTVNKVNGGVSGAIYRIDRVTSRAQGVDLVPGGAFPAETNEQAFDRLSQVDQEQDLAVAGLTALAARSVLVPAGEPGVTIPAVVDRAGYYLKFDPLLGMPIPGNPAADFVSPAIAINFTDLAAGAPGTFTITGTWPNLTWNIGIARGSPGLSGALTDGNYGMIAVSGGGATLTVRAKTVTTSMMADFAANTVLANITAGATTPQVIGLPLFTSKLALASSTDKGLAPAVPLSNATLYWLRGDNQYAKQPYDVPIACSDETTALTAGTAKVRFRLPRAMTLTGVRGSLNVAQTSGSIFTVDIKQNGTTIFGANKLTLDNMEKSSATAATAANITITALADDDEIQIDIAQIGDGTAKGLKVWLIGALG